MNETRIITNHRWHQFKYRYEVPQSVLDDQFDYQGPDEGLDGFIEYHGIWYHLDQFMRLDGDTEWHGAHGESYFSVILIKLSDDGEEYQIATALS